MPLPSQLQLTHLLRDAKAAHVAFEKATGKPDPDWEPWYASYILARLKGDASEAG